MPWHATRAGAHFSGRVPVGAMCGYIREVVPVGHQHCGCDRAVKQLLFFPHPDAAGSFPMVLTAMQHLLSFLPSDVEPVGSSDVSYGWIWPAYLGAAV
jgi:hypothetical protein